MNLQVNRLGIVPDLCPKISNPPGSMDALNHLERQADWMISHMYPLDRVKTIMIWTCG